MYLKIKALSCRERGNPKNCMCMTHKDLMCEEGDARGEKRGLKNDGRSYDVTENKGRENVRWGRSYDIHENKQLSF